MPSPSPERPAPTIQAAPIQSRPAPPAPPAQPVQPIYTDKELARIAGVGTDTIQKTRAILRDAPPQVQSDLRAGTISINAAHKQVMEQKKAEQEKSQTRSVFKFDAKVTSRVIFLEGV